MRRTTGCQNLLHQAQVPSGPSVFFMLSGNKSPTPLAAEVCGKVRSMCAVVCAARKKQHPAEHQNSYITTRYARFISSTPAFVVMRAVITPAKNASAGRSSKPESHEKETHLKFTAFRRLSSRCARDATVAFHGAALTARPFWSRGDCSPPKCSAYHAEKTTARTRTHRKSCCLLLRKNSGFKQPGVYFTAQDQPLNNLS